MITPNQAEWRLDSPGCGEMTRTRIAAETGAFRTRPWIAPLKCNLYRSRRRVVIINSITETEGDQHETARPQFPTPAHHGLHDHPADGEPFETEGLPNGCARPVSGARDGAA